MYLLHIFSRGTIDNAAFRPVLPHKPDQKIIFAGRCLHAEIEILSIEACHKDFRILKPQDADYVLLYRFRGSGGKGSQHRPYRQPLHKSYNFQIAGTKILSPLGNAVGLINGKQADLHAPGKPQKRSRLQALRRHINNFISSLRCKLQRLCDLSLRK